MLEDLIIEIEPIDRSNIFEEEKVVIDSIEETKMIKFDLTRNVIYFFDKDGWWGNYWDLKNDRFRYSYWKIYVILQEKYSYKGQQTNKLVKDILLNYYKIRVTTTDATRYYARG